MTLLFDALRILSVFLGPRAGGNRRRRTMMSMMTGVTLVLGFSMMTVDAFSPPPTLMRRRIIMASSSSNMMILKTRRSSVLFKMGLLDDMMAGFLNKREGDFVRLDDDNAGDIFGPGPLVVLYNVPAGVTKEEIQDMMADGAPQAFAKGIKLYRINSSSTGTEREDDDPTVLDQPMQQALENMMMMAETFSSSNSLDDASFQGPTLLTTSMADPVVVILFSGFTNAEMLAAYNILASEIYQETQQSILPACAKAVPNAMQKPLRQVLEEIGGDHQEAMSMDTQKEEE
jgi:hypothetical protein